MHFDLRAPLNEWKSCRRNNERSKRGGGASEGNRTERMKDRQTERRADGYTGTHGVSFAIGSVYHTALSEEARR